MSREFVESSNITQDKVLQLAALVRSCKHLVIHTGAGISTSAAIPDFRGPNGVWTLQDKGLQPECWITFEEAIPTLSHMAIAKLCQQGILKFLVTQNVDGLHRRSGIPKQQLAELHGCVFDERCEKCSTVYTRTFDVNTDNDEDHFTGRICAAPFCGGKLVDTIVDFGEDLPEAELQMAEAHSDKADLVICLGTSLQVFPAKDLPMKSKKNGAKMVIVNLQKTPLDKFADIRFFARIDDVMRLLLEALQLPLPRFTLVKTIALETGSRESRKGTELCLSVADADLSQLPRISKVEFRYTNDSGAASAFVAKTAPFCLIERTASPLNCDLNIHFEGFGGRDPYQTSYVLSPAPAAPILCQLEHMPEGHIAGAEKLARKARQEANKLYRAKPDKKRKN